MLPDVKSTAPGVGVGVPPDCRYFSYRFFVNVVHWPQSAPFLLITAAAVALPTGVSRYATVY